MHERPYLHQGDFEVYAAQIHNLEEAASLASLSFVDRLELMPVYFSTGSLVINTAGLQLKMNRPLHDLPIVGIVDSGIDPRSPLEPLVYAREMCVLPSEYNPSHGTSVAALAAALDGKVGTTLIPRCRLLDITAMPSTGGLDEDRLIDRLEEALQSYGSLVKHWNLSLAAEPDAKPTAFSDLAIALDDLHKRYGAMFFCAAGNSPDYRACWPPDSNFQERWVSSPGDTVCGITVGSCTDDNTPDDALAPKGAPSPFSPRGPVAYGVIKPDLLDVGGNIAGDGTPIGVNTIQRDGEFRTIPGTSFATPRVCGVSAEIQTCIERSGVGNTKPYLLAKALLLHHAKIPDTIVLGGDVRASDYYGYGRPSSLQDTIGDYFWRSTTLIYGQLYPNGEDLVIDDFPYPDGLCLDGKSRGQVWITMVSDPVLDSSFKTEYVRSNVDVHLGTVRHGKFTGQIKPIYTRIGNERSLIREEHKWSPIKQYRSPSRMNCLGNYWRLKVGLTLREKESGLIKLGVKKVEDYQVDVVIGYHNECCVKVCSRQGDRNVRHGQRVYFS
jgi:serine protease AprX